jgi:hypothetical protein
MRQTAPRELQNWRGEKLPQRRLQEEDFALLSSLNPTCAVNARVTVPPDLSRVNEACTSWEIHFWTSFYTKLITFCSLKPQIVVIILVSIVAE